MYVDVAYAKRLLATGGRPSHAVQGGGMKVRLCVHMYGKPLRKDEKKEEEERAKNKENHVSEKLSRPR